MTTGQLIAHHRQLKELSIRDLAAVIPMDHTKLWRIEHGVQEPKLSEVQAIAKALGIAPTKLHGNATRRAANG